MELMVFPLHDRRGIVLNNIRNGKLYQRGMDDKLMYSLMRQAYRHNLPVFVTTGNHEAYAVPYGVSPRKTQWMFSMGGLETVAGLNGPHGKRTASVLLDRLATDAANVGSLTNDAGLIESARNTYNNFNLASAWIKGKANGGIAADHNLTLYEITLAYGPTYGQVLTGNNFTPTLFDWFHTLFTPLSDWRVQYHQQSLVGLEWGEGENYKNISGIIPIGRADKQGTGVLPRATQSLSAEQKALIEAAQRTKNAQGPQGQLLLFSHFTLLNYHMPVAYSHFGTFIPSGNAHWSLTGIDIDHTGAGWNVYNYGTCEQRLDWYFGHCVSYAGAPKPLAVNYHFSGHSHRAGVYLVKQGSPPQHHYSLADTWLRHPPITVSAVFDPGLTPHAPANQTDATTRFIVSSCGGPIGVQNLDHELAGIGLDGKAQDGWTLRPPSGTLLDETATPPIQQIAYDDPHKNGQPRLCVALDYLEIDGTEHPLAWYEHSDWLRTRTPGQPAQILMVIGPRTQKLGCIQSIKLWGFKAGTNPAKGNGEAGTWQDFGPLAFSATAAPSERQWPFTAIRPPKAPYPPAGSGFYQLTLPGKLFRTDINKTHSRWFCEVTLQEVNHPQLKGTFKLDKWLFPVDFTVSSIVVELNRRAGEQGEVPDWDWLAKTFPGRYPVKEEVIK